MLRFPQHSGTRANLRRGVIANFGSVPVIRYFQTPLVVDNALRETIEEVAVG